MAYDFNMQIQAPRHTIGIDAAAQYGYFENDRTGSGGGLWFSDGELVDYDGVAVLPRSVAEAIAEAGFKVPEECY